MDNEPIEYLSADLRCWEENNEYFPSELRASEDHMARYDIDIWLLTGRTDHFMVPAILRRPA